MQNIKTILRGALPYVLILLLTGLALNWYISSMRQDEVRIDVAKRHWLSESWKLSPSNRTDVPSYRETLSLSEGAMLCVAPLEGNLTMLSYRGDSLSAVIPLPPDQGRARELPAQYLAREVSGSLSRGDRDLSIVRPKL